MSPARPLAFGIVLLFLLPTVPAQSQSASVDEILEKPGTPITFYGRVWDGAASGSAMPMNTQYPWGEEDYSIGGNTNCNVPTFLQDGNPGDNCGWHMYWFTTPGFISIKSNNEFEGYEQLHNERGQTKDIYLDTTQKPTSTLYTSSDAHGYFVGACNTGICWNWDPGYQPAWTVESYIWHTRLPGDLHGSASDAPDVSAVASRTEEAFLVAQGKWGPYEAWSLDETIPHPQADGTVNEHFAEMEWSEEFLATDGLIPKEHDIIVEFWWSNEHDNGNKYTLGTGFTYNLNSGEDFPNNVVLPVRNPLDVELVFPRFVHDKLVILSVLNTPWGSYDVDLETIDIQVTGPSGVIQPDPEHFDRFLDVSVAHSGHYDPINVTWVWDYEAQGLAPGEYTITVGATNFQGSYSTATDALFSITADGAGATQAGVSGLVSFTDNQFDAYAAGGDRAAGRGADAPLEEETTAVESESTPATPFLLGALALAGLAWRRRR